MINITVNGGKEFTTKLVSMPVALNKSLTKAITILTLELKSYIIRSKLSGQVLNHQTGNLWRSIQQKVETTPEQIVGSVFSSGDVKYAAIHEYGGTIKHPGGTAYLIDPKTKAAKFISNINATQNMPRTKAHNIPMPERSFMRSSLRDYQNKIQVTLDKAINDAAQ